MSTTWFVEPSGVAEVSAGSTGVKGPVGVPAGVVPRGPWVEGSNDIPFLSEADKFALWQVKEGVLRDVPKVVGGERLEPNIWVKPKQRKDMQTTSRDTCARPTQVVSWFWSGGRPGCVQAHV